MSIHNNSSQILLASCRRSRAPWAVSLFSEGSEEDLIDYTTLYEWEKILRELYFNYSLRNPGYSPGSVRSTADVVSRGRAPQGP